MCSCAFRINLNRRFVARHCLSSPPLVLQRISFIDNRECGIHRCDWLLAAHAVTTFTGVISEPRVLWPLAKLYRLLRRTFEASDYNRGHRTPRNCNAALAVALFLLSENHK